MTDLFATPAARYAMLFLLFLRGCVSVRGIVRREEGQTTAEYALVILAAAGPIWNPQTGVGGSNAPLVILLDDGWSAAASWDTRVKAADELIANADNDRRGVALVPLSETARDITLMPAGTARVALRQISPKPYSVDRVDALGALDRFLKSTGDAESRSTP